MTVSAVLFYANFQRGRHNKTDTTRVRVIKYTRASVTLYGEWADGRGWHGEFIARARRFTNRRAGRKAKKNNKIIFHFLVQFPPSDIIEICFYNSRVARHLQKKKKKNGKFKAVFCIAYARIQNRFTWERERAIK